MFHLQQISVVSEEIAVIFYNLPYNVKFFLSMQDDSTAVYQQRGVIRTIINTLGLVLSQKTISSQKTLHCIKESVTVKVHIGHYAVANEKACQILYGVLDFSRVQCRCRGVGKYVIMCVIVRGPCIDVKFGVCY